MTHVSTPSLSCPWKTQTSLPLKLNLPKHNGPKRSLFRTRRLATEDVQNTTENETAVPVDVCPGCGIQLSEAPKGCDQDGHIASGLGAVIGFEWWPIKAYRPCPAFEAAGKTYVRKGQITDEILFRRKKSKD